MFQQSEIPCQNVHKNMNECIYVVHSLFGLLLYQSGQILILYTWYFIITFPAGASSSLSSVEAIDGLLAFKATIIGFNDALNLSASSQEWVDNASLPCDGDQPIWQAVQCVDGVVTGLNFTDFSLGGATTHRMIQYSGAFLSALLRVLACAFHCLRFGI